MKPKRAVKEFFIVAKLEQRAKANATKTCTGFAADGNIGVSWYPGCRRFAWWDENGTISKKLAVKILMSRNSI